jgi:hypothetical protein
MNIQISAASLRRAADIKDQIEALQNEFDGILTGDISKLPNPLQLPLPRKLRAWTPERRSKFKRTMRLKRQGLK